MIALAYSKRTDGVERSAVAAEVGARPDGTPSSAARNLAAERNARAAADRLREACAVAIEAIRQNAAIACAILERLLPSGAHSAAAAGDGGTATDDVRTADAPPETAHAPQETADVAGTSREDARVDTSLPSCPSDSCAAPRPSDSSASAVLHTESSVPGMSASPASTRNGASAAPPNRGRPAVPARHPDEVISPSPSPHDPAQQPVTLRGVDRSEASGIAGGANGDAAPAPNLESQRHARDQLYRAAIDRLRERLSRARPRSAA